MPPHGFSWVVPDRVAALAAPSSADDLLWLRRNGIQLLVTLTEDPLPKRWIDDAGLMAIHVPIQDFDAPSLAQFKVAIGSITKAVTAEMAVAIHCQAGKGRTGTVLAAYLVSEGISTHDAIKKIRSLRPGSIETSEQERAIEAFEQAIRSSKA